MYKFKKSLIALAGLLSLVGVIALFTPQTIRSQTESAGPVKPVLVVNSPSEPVPVTGTVSVSNLGGSPLPVRDVDNPARQPYQISNQLPTGNNLVPDGKRFVIEYFSAKALTTADTNCTLASITIKTQTNSSFSPPRSPPDS